MSIFNYQIIQDLRERAANVPFRRACCYDINYFVIFIAVSRLNSWVNGSATRHARTIINSLYLWCGYRVRSGECHHVRSSRCGSNSLVELFCYVVVSFALFIIVVIIISVVWEDTWRWFVKWHRTRNKNIQRMRFCQLYVDVDLLFWYWNMLSISNIYIIQCIRNCFENAIFLYGYCAKCTGFCALHFFGSSFSFALAGKSKRHCILRQSLHAPNRAHMNTNFWLFRILVDTPLLLLL